MYLETVDCTTSAAGDIDARGADGSSSGYYRGSSGGSVDLIRTGTSVPASGTAVSVSGNILTYGGNAYAGSGADGGEGGQGGYVNISGGAFIRGYSASTALIGGIAIGGNIDAHGGTGASSSSSSGGYGGYGGDVILAGNGPVAVGNGSGTAINTAGGDSGNSPSGWEGSDGADGGSVTVYGTTITINGSIDAHGGRGGDGGEGYYSAGWGGDGGNVQLGADNANVHSVYDTTDEAQITTSSVNVTGSIDTHGGDGGNGLIDDGYSGAGSGGNGGGGGWFQLAATGPVTVGGSILTYGGIGGNGGAYAGSN